MFIAQLQDIMKILWNKIKSSIAIHPHLSIFCLAFIYVVLAGLFIQFIYLPYLAPPSMNAGNGLLSGYDGNKFHRIAVEASNQIKEIGWSAWKLKPERQIVSGIASIFYTLVTPKPWVLLPLNGFMHAIASLALFEILLLIVGKRGLAFLSLLPFVLFPSSLLWNAQMHNENYVIPGVLLFIYGWIYLANIERAINIKKSFKAILSIIIGSVVVWEVRDYVMAILIFLAFLIIILLIILHAIQWIKKQIHLKMLLPYFGLIALVWILGSPNVMTKIGQETRTLSTSSYETSSFSLDIGVTPDARMLAKLNITIPWTKTGWLPDQIDSNLKAISQTRAQYIKTRPNAGSQIDTEIVFGKASDVLMYIPRALEIGFLAPFPSEWFAGGYKSAASLMRKESGVEMIFIYLCLLGLIHSLWRFRTKIELWILFLISVGMLGIYTFTVPDIGGLYRFRYPYLMPLVCLGLSGLNIFYQTYIHSLKLKKA
jgi:hypothetical protein